MFSGFFCCVPLILPTEEIKKEAIQLFSLSFHFDINQICSHIVIERIIVKKWQQWRMNGGWFANVYTFNLIGSCQVLFVIHTFIIILKNYCCVNYNYIIIEFPPPFLHTFALYLKLSVATTTNKFVCIILIHFHFLKFYLV